MNQVLSPLRGKKLRQVGEKVAHVSGDSQYLNESVVRALWQHGASFTIAAPKTILWHEKTEKLEWSSYQYSDDELKKFSKKKFSSPPEAQLALWNWWPCWGEDRVVFPVVIKTA